jgi:hypothetical protein
VNWADVAIRAFTLTVGICLGLAISAARERKRREPIWKPHETDETIRDLIRQRDRFQRQAIDMQLAANGLLAEREELFRELRRRAN